MCVRERSREAGRLSLGVGGDACEIERERIREGGKEPAFCTSSSSLS